MDKDIKTRMLSVFEIVIDSLRICGTRFKYILPICLAVYIPLNILLLFLPSDLYEKLLGFVYMAETPDTYYLRYVGILLALKIIFIPLLAGALSYITVQDIEGRQVKTTEILDASLMRWGKLVYTSALYYGIIIISAPLFFPIFYFGIVFILYPCIVAISSKYGFSALLISRVLMRGKWLKGFGLFLLNGIVLLGMQVVLGLIVGWLGIPVDDNFAWFVLSLINNCLEAFSYVSVCLFYINIHYNFSGKESLQ